MNDMPTTSFFLLLLFLTATAAAADLITATCNHTLYFNICMTRLLSDPRSRGADLRGLAAISIDLSAAHANNTIAWLKSTTAAAAADADRRTKMAFDDCSEEYGDAMDNLRESAAALSQADYNTVNAMVSAAMTDADSCEDGLLKRKGMALQAVLSTRNDYFCKLCSNSLAITALIA